MTVLDAMMGALLRLLIALLLAWVGLNLVAELAHAWKSRTARSLVNIYSISFGLSIGGLIYVFAICTECAESADTPLFQALIDWAVLYMALCVVSTHTCVRGMSLVLDLFAVSSQHPFRAKCARASLRQFLTYYCIMGGLYVLTIAPYLLLWILGG
jgi:hypothetical protein